MKKFYKVCFIIAAVCLGIGIMLSCVGLISGGSFAILHNMWQESRKNSQQIYSESDKESKTTKESGTEAGTEEEKDTVENVDIDINFGDVRVLTGDKFSVYADSAYQKEMSCYVENKTFVVKHKLDNEDDTLDWSYYTSGNSKDTITITLPANTELERFAFTVGGGEGSIEDIRAKNGILSVGAGKLDAEQVTFLESGSIKVGAGEICVSEFCGANLDLKCGMGDVEIEGVLYENNKIKCGVGKIDMELLGHKSNYTYQTESRLGSIEVNDSSKKQEASGKAIGNIDISCDMGKVKINFTGEELPENNLPIV